MLVDDNGNNVDVILLIQTDLITKANYLIDFSLSITSTESLSS